MVSFFSLLCPLPVPTSLTSPGYRLNTSRVWCDPSDSRTSRRNWQPSRVSVHGVLPGREVYRMKEIPPPLPYSTRKISVSLTLTELLSPTPYRVGKDVRARVILSYSHLQITYNPLYLLIYLSTYPPICLPVLLPTYLCTCPPPSYVLTHLSTYFPVNLPHFLSKLCRPDSVERTLGRNVPSGNRVLTL